MASNAAKSLRRAYALNDLDRLSELLAEHFSIEMPNLRPTHKDPELQRIQRIEAINELLVKVLDSVGVETKVETPEPEVEEDQTDEPDLEHMSKGELLDLAEKRGVEVKKSASKAKIIEALNA